MSMGRIICCGLGPGDPDLMSVRADREVRAATHIAYFRKKGRPGQARAIVDGMLAEGVREYAMEYPVTTELAANSEEYARLLASFHDEWAERLVGLARTTDVVVLCEGDPFLYGSFMHLYARLQGRAEVEVIAGIPGMAGCWNAAGMPMTLGDDVMTILVGTLPEAELERRARSSDALVTPEVSAALADATDVLGYAPYVARVPPRDGLRLHPSDNRQELQRAGEALKLAGEGRRVVLVSSGDPGVFAMAAAVFEALEGLPDLRDLSIRVLPGVTAMLAAAARAGAPLGHDFCAINLSDNLKPWSVIERRLRLAAESDFSIAI
jgi:precorrin-2/cobalt-factor-2 C20-methyltransferase